MTDPVNRTYELHVWDEYARAALVGLLSNNALRVADSETVRRACDVANLIMQERKRRGVPVDKDPLVFVDPES